jgi:gluconate 2-dehydrogenase gamma chain
MTNHQTKRRGFLRDVIVGSAAVATSAAAPLGAAAATADAQAGNDAAVLSSTPAGYAFLMPTEAAFIEAVADHMYPADAHGPGGVDIGIPVFVDRALAGSWGTGDRLYMEGPWQQGVPSQGYQLPLTPAQLFRQGIASTNEACRQQFGGKTFDALAAADKDAVLNALAGGKLAFGNGLPSQVFFGALYECVVQGIFADPIYGGNKDKAGWRLVGFPGVLATHANDIDTYRNKAYPAKFMGIADLA